LVHSTPSGFFRPPIRRNDWQMEVVMEVAEPEESARQHDLEGTMKHLKSAGDWAFVVARAHDAKYAALALMIARRFSPDR
jgi:hypothetical protein